MLSKEYSSHAEFTAMRAKIMIQTGRIDQARLDLEKTIQLNPFDSDAFVYVGMLNGVFEQAARALHPDGLFTFTVESLDETETDVFILLETARYAHSAHYIEHLAKKHGYD